MPPATSAASNGATSSPLLQPNRQLVGEGDQQEDDLGREVAHGQDARCEEHQEEDRRQDDDREVEEPARVTPPTRPPEMQTESPTGGERDDETKLAPLRHAEREGNEPSSERMSMLRCAAWLPA